MAPQLRRRRARTQRQFFTTLVENMNPFAEKPEETTRKRYQAKVDAVAALEPSMKARSDDELREFTKDLRRRATSGTSLDDLLPEAFAVVREASSRVLGLRHFDVQLMGGMALHEGQIAEMGTGEGKTLVAILPCFLNALAGKGCHVVTVNDYLARRDAEWVGQPLRFLGVSVGIVQSGMMPEQKKKAYRCDVTYVTNSELGFDYLRDQMAPSPSDLCLREQSPFNFCVVDEVDSILIDEARTPLIISGTANNPSSKYEIAREVAKTLRKNVHYTVDEKQRNCILIEEGVDAAEKLLEKDDLFDPQDPWFPFLLNALNAKELYIRDKQYIVKKKEIFIVDEFTGRVMEGRRWSNGLHQAIEAKESVPIQAESVTLASISYQSLFRLFDKLSGMTGTAYTEAKEFGEIYKLKAVVIPPNRSRLREDKDDQVFIDEVGKWKAVARETERQHRIGRPVLIGTTNVENSEIIAELLDALGVTYQLLNAKPENVARETEIVAGSGRLYAVTIATNMAGRGTDILLGGNSSMMARLKLREELYSKLFPKKTSAWIMPEDFYPSTVSAEGQKLVTGAVQAAVKAWCPAKSAEQPTSVEAAERILDAELTELEAEERLSLACEKAPTTDPVVLLLRKAFNFVAAEFKELTEAEKKQVVALGGLFVLGTERHESRRIDNQLRGRCARQGDPGTTRFFLSLNDAIFRIFGGDAIKKMMGTFRMANSDSPLESPLLSNSLGEAQGKVENYYYSVRKNVFEYDDVMDTQRKIVYGLRRRALLDNDDSIKETMTEFAEKNMEDFVRGFLDPAKAPAEWPLELLAENVGTYCAQLQDKVTKESLEALCPPGVEGPKALESMISFCGAAGRQAFIDKCKEIDETGAGLTGVVNRRVMLMQLDTFWQQHLKNMDFMRTGVSLRSYGQKNPLTEYKLEGYQVFLKMMARIRRNAIYNIFLFMPRKLKPMTKERIQELVPNRTVRRAQLQEILQAESKATGRPVSELGPTMITLARLALNVRQLLTSRSSLQDLAVASFEELKDSFARAGLFTQGDQIRWAATCSDLELIEDTVYGEIFIGFKKDVANVVATGKVGGEAQVDDKSFEESVSELATVGASEEEMGEKVRQALKKAAENEEFVSSAEFFAQKPAAFLSALQASAAEQQWTKDDIDRMRGMFKMAGMDIDAMMVDLEENADEMPEDQRQVVEYMRKMLKSPDQAVAEAKQVTATSAALTQEVDA